MSNPEDNAGKNYVRRRVSTEAYNASEEFMEVLHDNESFCYKPWQFSDSEVCADTLKTTYDEIAIWGVHEAMLRPGFKIDDGIVHVPNLFSKVKGVSKDIDGYMKNIDSLVRSKNILLFKKLPMVKTRNIKNICRIYTSVLNDKGYIDKDRLLSSEYWKYKGLKPSLQEALANRIIAFCSIPDFWKYKNFKVKLNLKLRDKIKNYLLFYNDYKAKDEYFMKVSTFEILLNLNDNFLNLLTNFDYPMSIPKIIIYNNGKSIDFTFSDAAILMFMNSMGVDVVIYNPCGESDIENYVKENYFDSHTLDQIGNKVPFRKNSFFRGIF